MKDLIISLVVDAMVLGSFIAWKVLGIVSAGMFFTVLMWIFTAMMALAIFSAQPRPKRKGFLSWLRWLKGCVFAACVVSAAIYAGLVALSVCYALAWMLLQAKYFPTEPA